MLHLRIKGERETTVACISGRVRRGKRVNGKCKKWLVKAAGDDREAEEQVSKDAGVNE